MDTIQYFFFSGFRADSYWEMLRDVRRLPCSCRFSLGMIHWEMSNEDYKRDLAEKWPSMSADERVDMFHKCQAQMKEFLEDPTPLWPIGDKPPLFIEKYIAEYN
jgi:hypothetical protein